MDAAFHMIDYLGPHHNSSLCMNLTYPDIDDEQFPVIDWDEFYSNIKEPIPLWPLSHWANQLTYAC